MWHFSAVLYSALWVTKRMYDSTKAFGGSLMIDAYQRLWAKKSDLVRGRKEVESLRIVATLLSETHETQSLRRDGDKRTVVKLDGSHCNDNAS